MMQGSEGVEGFMLVMVVTMIAGVGGTGLGGMLTCCMGYNSKRVMGILLSFAAGLMMGIVCFELLQEALSVGAQRIGGTPLVMILTVLGYGLTAALGSLLEGVLGGGLRLGGWIMALAIALHNIPEGMVVGATFAHEGTSLASGMVVALVIALHNIPEGMAVAGPFLAGGGTTLGALSLTALAGTPTVVGAAAGYWMGNLGDWTLLGALSLASGAMLYVIFTELLPQSQKLWRGRAISLAAVTGLLVGLWLV